MIATRLLALSVAISTGALAEPSVDRMLYAIAQVETGNNPDAIGQAGERTEWQFMEVTWHMHTSARFGDPQFKRIVAENHCRFIIAVLRQNHIVPTPHSIARKWNPGAPASYSRRVANLYYAK